MITTQETGLAAERLENIRRVLQERRIVRVDELSRALRVSPATVRRDLLLLERVGHLRRVHGGAVAIEGLLEEPQFDDKAAQSAAEKQRIAQAALQFVKPTDSIFLDGGSTVLALARLLTDMKQLTVVTNSLHVALLYAGRGPRLILVGGELRRLSQTFVGPLTRALVDQLRVDTAFMGTLGVAAEGGLTTTDPQEAYTKELVMSHARQAVLLADASKIGKISFVRFGGLRDVDVWITDRRVSAVKLREFRKETKIVVV